jgi:hypothetical protein
MPKEHAEINLILVGTSRFDSKAIYRRSQEPKTRESLE